MSSTNADPTRVLGNGRSGAVLALAFQPDGKHLLGGGQDGIRRWRLEDGQEVGRQRKIRLRAIAVSKDDKWVVCGTYGGGASVWDAELRKSVINVEGGSQAVQWAVDVSPDSTRFATGTETQSNNRSISIWSVSTGERLLGPISHSYFIYGIRFSPSGEHIATATRQQSVRVFDSLTGDEVANIKCDIPTPNPCTPFAWSKDGQRIFAISREKVKCFSVNSTGPQLLAESYMSRHGHNDIESISLAANGKFVTTYTGPIISFLDASTLTQIGSVVKDSEIIRSVALSSDNTYLATGRGNGTISIRNLGGILPDSYGPFHALEQPPEEQSPTSNNELSGSTTEESEKSNPRQSEAHGDGDDDLLEVEVLSRTPALDFDYDEPPSPVSAGAQNDIGPPPDPSNDRPQSLGVSPIASPLVSRLKNITTIKSSQALSALKGWLPKSTEKNKRDPRLHEHGREPRVSPQPADQPTHPRPSAGARDPDEEPSWIAAGQYNSRASAGIWRKKKPKSRAKRKQGASHGNGRQHAAEKTSAGQTQVHDQSHSPSASLGIHVTDEPDTGTALIAIRLPAWMLCRGLSIGDGTHG